MGEPNGPIEQVPVSFRKVVYRGFAFDQESGIAREIGKGVTTLTLSLDVLLSPLKTGPSICSLALGCAFAVSLPT